MIIKRAFIITFALLALLITAPVVTLWLSSKANEQVAEAEVRRYQSFKLADELRQSSDDLTRMARTYAATGNPVYREYFQEILDIRDGTRNRPVDYDRAYWDLVQLDGQRPTPAGKPQSLQEHMHEMQFTDEEFAMLEMAQNESDKLVELEDQAMFAMVGMFDDGSGSYSVKKAPDPALARQLLHGEQYHQAKAEIMSAINVVFDCVEARTLREVEMAQAKEKRYHSLAWPLGLLAIVASVFSYFFLKRYAVAPIHELSTHAAALSEGEYEQHVEARGFNEVKELSQTFNQMSEAIVHDIEQRNVIQEELRAAKDAALDAYDKIKADLAAAAKIQKSLLPDKMPDFPGIRFSFAYAPCDDLAGDMLNVFPLDDSHIALYILDVSGHGVQAFLLASTLSQLLTPIKTPNSVLWEAADGGYNIASPASVAKVLNERFPMDPDTSQYFTIHYGVLDTRNLEYTFISAGYPGPMHISAEGKQEILHASGAGIGILEAPVFEQKNVNLAAGDRLFLFCDGILEASDENGAQFLDDQLSTCLRAATDMTTDGCMEHLIQSVIEWTHGDQEDDISALMMQIDRT